MRKIFASLLIAVGVLIILSNLDIISIESLMDYLWPSLLILIGLYNLVRDRRIQIFSVILIAIGTIYLLNELEIIYVTINQIMVYFWPGLLILIGLNILFSRPRKIRPIEPSSKPRHTSNHREYNAFLNSVNEQVNNTNFEYCSVNSVMASAEIDFSMIEFKNDSASIEINSVLSSVLIKLPAGVRISLSGSPILGDITDKSMGDPNSTKTLNVNFTCILGNIEIIQ
jgi:predicted membrane protein